MSLYRYLPTVDVAEEFDVDPPMPDTPGVWCLECPSTPFLLPSAVPAHELFHVELAARQDPNQPALFPEDP